MYAKPEPLAAPNKVWSWDITKLKGSHAWVCYHLDVILDIFSRYVVGWMIAAREWAELANQLIGDTVAKQRIALDHLDGTCRSRHQHALQACGDAARRSRGHQDPQPPARVGRQSARRSEHRHGGIALMSPETVLYGRATALSAKRAATLEAAFIARPLRFKSTLPKLPDTVWINPPKPISIPPPSPIWSLI